MTSADRDARIATLGEILDGVKHIVHIPKGLKFPVTDEWQIVEHQTLDETLEKRRRTIRRAAGGQNFGILMGENGLVAVDVDFRKLTDNGEVVYEDTALFEDVITKLPTDRPLFIVRTQSGSFHIYFRSKEYSQVSTKVKGVRGVTGAIDLCAGVRQMVGPTSRHRNRSYDLLKNGDDERFNQLMLVETVLETCDLDDAPEMKALFKKKPSSTSSTSSRRSTSSNSSQEGNSSHRRPTINMVALAQQLARFLSDADGVVLYSIRDYKCTNGSKYLYFTRKPGTAGRHWCWCPRNGEEGHRDHEVDNMHPVLMVSGNKDLTTLQRAKLGCIKDDHRECHLYTGCDAYIVSDLYLILCFSPQIHQPVSWRRRRVDDRRPEERVQQQGGFYRPLCRWPYTTRESQGWLLHVVSRLR